jgi:hypothetical protein
MLLGRKLPDSRGPSSFRTPSNDVFNRVAGLECPESSAALPRRARVHSIRKGTAKDAAEEESVDIKRYGPLTTS